MRLLFIGGVADGELREVPDDWRSVKIPQKIMKLSLLRDDCVDSVILVDLYERQQIPGKYKTYEVMLYNNTTRDHMIAKLLTEYRLSKSRNQTDIST